MGVAQDVLGRYEQDAQGRIVIDVAAERPETLYNCFDKHAPYIRRDLDQELADYLVSCEKELPPRIPLILRFTFAAPQEQSKYERVRDSVRSFFRYLAELERDAIAQMMRKSAIFFAVGMAIMFAAVGVREWFDAARSVVAEVVTEGLTVAAWVSLWEAAAVFLLEWTPRRRSVRRFERLAEAEVTFRCVETE